MRCADSQTSCRDPDASPCRRYWFCICDVCLSPISQLSIHSIHSMGACSWNAGLESSQAMGIANCGSFSRPYPSSKRIHKITASERRPLRHALIKFYLVELSSSWGRCFYNIVYSLFPALKLLRGSTTGYNWLDPCYQNSVYALTWHTGICSVPKFYSI